MLPPLLLSRQEDVQCVLLSVMLTDPGSEDIPTQLLKMGGKKLSFLMSFSLYWISNNFPRTVHREMCGCLLCCLDCWVFKSPYMQFLSVLLFQHRVCLSQRILLWRTCHGSRGSVFSPGGESKKPFSPCQRSFFSPLGIKRRAEPWDHKDLSSVFWC